MAADSQCPTPSAGADPGSRNVPWGLLDPIGSAAQRQEPSRRLLRAMVSFGTRVLPMPLSPRRCWITAPRPQASLVPTSRRRASSGLLNQQHIHLDALALAKPGSGSHFVDHEGREFAFAGRMAPQASLRYG